MGEKEGLSMKFLPLPREKRRLLDPLGRTALTCLLTAGSFGGPVRPAAPGSDGGRQARACRDFAACWAAVRGPFCFCRFRQACASWRRPFSSFPAASPFMIPGCLPAGLPARSGGGAAAAGAVGVSHRPAGPAVGPVRILHGGGRRRNGSSAAPPGPSAPAAGGGRVSGRQAG